MKVGIDLGTTNSALAYIEPLDAEDSLFPPVQIFPISQLVSASRVEARRTLPSFLLLEEGEPVGAFARDQGALVPTRLVHSAKSWLSNDAVDRTAKILPWDSPEAGRVLSPVEVSSRFLAKMREEWDASGRAPLAEQEIVLTVPASFDEEARELTVRAAAEAGLPHVVLLEEPAAAFYSWISHNLAQSRRKLFDGQIVLICDVGGGTSDFSLIRVGRDGDKVEFTRTAVGKHLLLGGDNLDLTLAWLAEQKLGAQLSIRQRSGLRRQCSAAKEVLLADATRKSVEITVLGSGSSLIGGSLKTEITREEALELTLEGFLPLSAKGELPKEEKGSLFRELGLPYETDPAISKHLNAFLEQAGQVPDAILFNGGFFLPEICRTRVADILEHWYGKRPDIFDHRDLDLAVATGAAYYSYVRSTGSGVLVRGGLPRSYYIGIGDAAGEDVPAVCLVPRGTEEGSRLEVDRGDLRLMTNKPVSFRLYSSLTRADDVAGEAVTLNSSEVHHHAPLEAVIRYGKPGEKLIPVKLGAYLTEVGTLETWCDSKVSENRWRLEFQLRKAAVAQAARPSAVVSEEHLTAACGLVAQFFSLSGSAPEELPGRLEQTLGLGRNSWPASVNRSLADVFLETAEGRKKSSAFEARWLNLCGFCLRPGFGFPGDDYRVEQARRVYAGGLQYPNQVQCEIDWWIFAGRIAGGLNRNQQVDLFQRISPILLPRGGRKAPRTNSSLLREMWRTACSLELLPVSTRTDLGDAILKARQFGTSELWCIGRLGARSLFYGPVNQVLPPATAGRWAEAMLTVDRAADALAQLARHTGDPTRDVAPVLLAKVRAYLEKAGAEDLLDDNRSERSRERVFGEALPSGLVITPA